MFSCKKCKALEEQLAHMREENLKLINRLTAIISPNAYGAVIVSESQVKLEQDVDEEDYN